MQLPMVIARLLRLGTSGIAEGLRRAMRPFGPTMKGARGRSSCRCRGLPGAAVVTADVGAVGAGGDPEFFRFGPLDGGAVAVGRGGGGGPGFIEVEFECCGNSIHRWDRIIATDCNEHVSHPIMRSRLRTAPLSKRCRKIRFSADGNRL